MAQAVSEFEIQRPLIDPFARAITYLRVSVTDRCDFRCVYCMSENMAFLPKADLLTLEELDRLCSAFVATRRAQAAADRRRAAGAARHHDARSPRCRAISRRGALDELTLTTNGSQLPKYAARARRATASSASTSRSTRSIPTSSAPSPAGASSTRCSPASTPRRPPGLRVKINAVALKGVNEDEIPALVEWAHGRGMELTLIEVMPLGDVGEGRLDQYLPLSMVRARLAERFTLDDIDYRTGGPARYVRVAETGGTLGFITPLTHNFCESCNRVRITCTGTLYMCLGQEDAADLRAPLRASEANELLDAAIDEAIARKPKGHDFVIDRRHQRPACRRHMSVTGG